ncbi:hypothetical protein EVAR_2688_1 [Eumeta japonica]|uniref:Uncharacterized protein n=1 Tax=Eumeta variegata TaxID=151549 RepID=A0A4C1SM93_EUMVA|nr:hypothetical protein EVAR_2688_1 [Eumeta japonica]
MSKAILLINSDSETSINDLKNDVDGESQIQLLVTQLQEQLSHKSKEIIKLQEEIEHKNKRILSLENFNEEVEDKVTSSNHKIANLEAENSVLKSSIETLKSTIENQKICIDDLHSNAQSYNDLIESLQIELDDNNQIKTQIEQVDDAKSELMFSNENKLYENTEYIKKVIQKLKNLICLQKQEINELIMKVDSISTDKDHNTAELHAEIADKEKQIINLNEELLNFKHETDRSIIEINRLTQENSNLLKTKQTVLKQSSDIELHCENLKTEMKTVVNQKNVEINNLIADLRKANLKIDELTHEKTLMDEKNKQLMSELKTLESKIKDFENDNKDVNQKQYYVGKSKEIITKIHEILILLNGSFDENLEIDNVEESYRVFSEYIDMIQSLTKNMKSQNIIVIDNNNKLKTELLETKENHTIQLSEAIDKIKELLSVISDRPFDENVETVDEEGVFNIFKKYIEMLRPLVTDIKSQNETALRATMELKEKHQSEIQSLKSHLNLIQNEKTITENRNASLIKQYGDLLVDLKSAQSNIIIKDQTNTELINKINTLGEVNASLESKLVSCNSEITVFKSNELQFKSHIADIENEIIKKSECKQDAYLEQFETTLKLVQENFSQKLEMIQQLVFEKGNKISEITDNLHITINSLGNKRSEMKRQIHALQSTLAESEKTLDEVTNKLKWFADLLYIDFIPFNICEDNNKNKGIYSSIPQFLAEVYSIVKTWKEERNDSSNIKEKLIHLQSNYNALLQNFDEINDKYKLSLIEIEEIKLENTDLNNNLLQKSKEFESQKIEIESLYSNIQQLINQVKSLQDYNMNMQSKYLGCEDNFANVKNKVNKNTVLTNTDVLENNARSDISEFVSQSSSFQLNCPRTLISICCIKIAELLSNNELNITEKPSTFSSDLQTESRTLEPPDKSSFTCSCNDCLHALEMLHDNNQMKKEIQKLELLRQNLIVERDQYKEEIVSLINLTTELHKKIINHRTNLSTLTATTYAENKLLKSQVKVLQHHLKRFHDVCQIGFPSIKTQLSQLLTVLQTDPNYFKLPIFCIDEPEKESITSDKKSTQVLPHFDTTIESDLLMLDTNVTFASDSTLIENNQTDLDLSQTLCLNNLETLFNESKENCKLNTQSSINQTKVSYTEVQCNDTITSPNLESLCKWECNFNELKTLLNAKNAEFEKLQVKLVEMKDEKDELEEKLNLLSEPLSIEATKKMKNLEQDCLLKTDEVKKLQNSLQQKNEELKQLQEEVDNLSTEVMDNISEVDSLRTQLDSFQVSNSELTQKCLKLETILAEKENLSHGKKEISVCRECIIKDEIIQKLESSQLHAENNLGKAMETDSERYNKIEEINKNLQNELDASKEDCQKINEEVATIKSHLEKSNLSTASNINLDDAHVFNITKNLRSPERRPLSKLTLTMPDIDEEITSIDLYVCEKMECWNFYAEEMGLEKENLNHDIKIIDIMRMLYNGLLVKHGNEVENLLNKLRDFETSKALLKEKFDQLSLDYDKITQELEDKNKMLKLLSDRSLLLNKIIKEFQENLMSSENCAELVSQFKDKVLNMVDIELSTSTVNVFEKLIDNIANKQEKDLTNIMSKYTQLKDHMEKLVVEQNNLNENLVLMKNQLADKESKYNTLKMQKERIHEINNAVTLDIIKKEQELNSIVVDGWRKLVSHDIIKAEHNYGALPLGTSVQKLFENCIHMHQKFKAIQNNTKYESEIENLKTEIANMKYLLEDKAREYESLRSSFDTVQEINKTISSELQIKEEEFRKLMLLHEEVSQKCQSQSIELISNSSKVDNLNRDISALKELLGCQESTIKTLEVQIQTCEMEKRVAVEQELKFSTMLKEIQNLQHESSELKAANNAITKEKEYYSIELEKSKTVIKEQNEELSKISAQISVLNEVLNEKIKNIENLQGVGKIVLKENDNLRKECAALTKKINEVSQQHEEKENEYKRLETNLKTHEKTAEIQNNIIKKLQKQKENDQATINEKVKSLGEKDTLIEQLNERYTELLKKYELILQQLREKRNNRDCINSDREVIEGCLKGLENEMEGLRSGRNSLEADARRRRRSLHDAHRAMNNQNKEEEIFMAVLDSVDQNLTEFAVIVSNNSNSSGVMRPSSRRESGCERHEKCPITEKEDSNGRLSDVTDAARRRRQSVHDLRRSVRSPLTLNGWE